MRDPSIQGESLMSDQNEHHINTTPQPNAEHKLGDRVAELFHAEVSTGFGFDKMSQLYHSGMKAIGLERIEEPKHLELKPLDLAKSGPAHAGAYLTEMTIENLKPEVSGAKLALNTEHFLAKEWQLKHLSFADSETPRPVGAHLHKVSTDHLSPACRDAMYSTALPKANDFDAGCLDQIANIPPAAKHVKNK
jgi:hypothetical protein